MSIVGKLIRASKSDSSNIWDAVKIKGLHIAGDTEGEVSAVLEMADERAKPIRCEACGEDVTQYPSVAVARITMIDSSGLINIGPFRLCERCHDQAVREDHPHMTFLARWWPPTRESYISGYFSTPWADNARGLSA